MAVYRSHQVFSKFANQAFKYIVMFAYIVGSFILISLGFLLIRFGHSMPFIFSMFDLILFQFLVVFIVCLVNLARRFPTLSTEWYFSYLEHNFYETKLDRLFWNSCQPIVIQVGDFCTISTGEFILKMMGNVVLDNMVTLLLTF